MTQPKGNLSKPTRLRLYEYIDYFARDRSIDNDGDERTVFKIDCYGRFFYSGVSISDVCRHSNVSDWLKPKR